MNQEPCKLITWIPVSLRFVVSKHPRCRIDLEHVNTEIYKKNHMPVKWLNSIKYFQEEK